jgi:uncharacterized membrane protein
VESRVKLLGHPIHPMLIVFPLGLLATAVIFDILYVATANDDLATFSYYALVAGVISGLLAALFGLLDWTKIPKDTRARRIGAVHGVGNVIVTGLFALSLASRWGDAAYLPTTLPMVLGLIGAVIALFTAWLGGELVYRLRVGVDEDANLDASNSISREGIAEIRT